jgi:hypothetical protein
MHHVLKMQYISLLHKYIKWIYWDSLLSVFTFGNTDI